MKLIIYIAIILLFLSSCKKDKTLQQNQNSTSTPMYDTIYPGSYYPVYPGSSWTYLVNDTGTTILSTSTTYQIHSYKNSQSGTYSDSCYVPFFNSKPIYGYDKIDWVAPPFGDYYTIWPILSETVGFNFQRDWEDTRFGDFSEKVKVTQKYFDGTDSVLVLEGHWVYGPNINNKSYQEYKKGIGLAFECIVDTTINDTLSKKVLTSYFVNG